MSLSRRNFLKCGLLTGASVALTACQRNVEHHLVSQYQMPEYRLPGQPLYWATTCGECSGGCGVAIKTTDGRAIKVDGIPEHPLSRGKVCARGQSSLQVAYHPSRLNDIADAKGTVLERDWGKFYASALDKTKSLADKQPLFVTHHLKGTLGGLMVELAKEVGGKIWVLDYPSRWAERQVVKSLTGKAELPHYQLEKADYVVTFGGDLLSLGHNSVYANWGYGQFRQGKGRERGTLVSVSSRINMTAANSDRWLSVRPGSEGWVALAVGNLLAAKGKGPWPAWAKAVSLEKVAEVTGLDAGLIEKLAVRLGAAKNPLVIADSDAGNYSNGVESVWVIHALQKLLTGTIKTFEPENVLGVKGGVPKDLVVNTQGAIKHLESNNCAAIWTFDVDVVPLLPSSLNPAELLKKGGTLTAFSTFANQTTALAKTVVPIYNWIEDFGDQRITGADLDVYNVQQPAITSLWSGARSLGDILAAVKVGDPISLGVVPEGAAVGAAKGKTFRDLIKGDAAEGVWETMLARGGSFQAESLDWDIYKHRTLTPPPLLADPGKLPAGVNPYENIEAASVSAWTENVATGPVLVPFATLSLKDGSLGNRPWMQELPDPITTVVWGPWIEINSTVAAEKKIERHDVISVTLEGVAEPIVGPAFPMPSLHPDAIGIPVGQENPDFSGWSGLNFGLGSKAFGRYGYTNANYGKGGINPLSRVKGEMTNAGEPRWVGHKVAKIEKLNKTEMITAMDIRVFNLPREILPF
ncbi:twin-arginine translocation signal domain-containing protein [bacterium]|nr:twin-arginine translocation signal domain-containing protein [bacterium]